MTSSAWVVLVAAGYLALNLAVGLWPAKRSSASAAGWVAGDRALGLVVMYFVTGATIFSAFAFLGAPGWAYERGVAALYILAYGVLGFLPFYFLGPRAAALGREHGFVTQAEMVAHRFGSRAIAGWMALVSLLAFVPYLALQISGAGLVVEVVTRGAVPAWAGGLAVYLVVTLYVLKSGVLGVGWTNVLQGVFMLVLAWVLGLWLPAHLYGGVAAMFDRLLEARPELLEAPGLSGGKPWSWLGWSTSVLVSMIGFSAWPHLFMKAFGAKDGRTIRRTVVLYPTFQVFLVPIVLIGLAGVLFEPRPERADQILPHLLMHLELPPLVVGLFCAGALAASMSSGDAIAHAAASIAVRDGWITALGRRLEPARERAATRVVLVLVMIAAYLLAISWQGSLVSLLLHHAYGPVTQLAPPLWAALLWKRATAAGAIAGLAGGIGANVLFSIRPELLPADMHPGLPALALNVALLVGLSLGSGARNGERPHRGEESGRSV